MLEYSQKEEKNDGNKDRIRPSTAGNSEGRLVETCMIHRYLDNTIV